MIWHLLGAGALGSLAAGYLLKAGHQVEVLRRPHQIGDSLIRHLQLASGKTTSFRLPLVTPSSIHHLLVATKAGDTATALLPWRAALADNLVIVSLQNGMGQWDGVDLPAGAQLITAITQSGASRQGDSVRVAAENATVMGDGRVAAPDWLVAWKNGWPQLVWREGIIRAQWQKLAVNAVINPLTASLRCQNGGLLQPEYLPLLRALAAEVDQVFSALATDWPNDTLQRACEVAGKTASNTSSMLADVLAGRPTEIAFINGWLLRQAKQRGIEAPLNQQLFEQLG